MIIYEFYNWGNNKHTIIYIELGEDIGLEV